MAFIGGVLYGLSYPDFNILLLAFMAVFLNSTLDMVDGALARVTGTASKRGDFLDHIIDRYADVFLICGITFGGFIPVEWGMVSVVGVLLVSYVGTQAQAVSRKRYYGGFLGRADRLVVIMVATLFTVIYPWDIDLVFASMTILGWGVLIIGILSHVTALQRITAVWKKL
jgi:phosphatidylglycerophosphate synthase